MTLVNIHRKKAPAWFESADFGIFIHWGLYSVPAFAPAPLQSKHLTQFRHCPIVLYADLFRTIMLLPDVHNGRYQPVPFAA